MNNFLKHFKTKVITGKIIVEERKLVNVSSHTEYARKKIIIELEDGNRYVLSGSSMDKYDGNKVQLSGIEIQSEKGNELFVLEAQILS